MKKRISSRPIGMARRMWIQFVQQHLDCLKALKAIYVKENGKENPNMSSTLSIKPFGSLYKVLQIDYLFGELIGEQSWIATYIWSSSGHLLEVGGDRYCFFNPAQKSMYLETPTIHGEHKADLYYQKSQQ